MPEQTRAEFKYLIERQKEEIRTVNEVGRLLSSTIDPTEVVRLVAQYLKQAFPLALCAALVIDQRKLQLIQFAKIAQVDFKKAILDICAKATALLSRPIQEENLSITIEDSSADGQWGNAPIGYLRSSYMATLKFKNQTVGCLGVWGGKEEAFAKEDQHVIDIVADQMGAALRNAFLLDELKRAGELKNDLLKVISHELRIPLTTIKDGVSLVLEGALGPTTADQVDFLKTVSQNTNRLEAVIEKVETATQLIAGQLEYRFTPMALGELIKETAAACTPTAQEKGVELRVEIGSSPLQCPVDPKRIKQALSALVENGIQATPAGGRVAIHLTETPKGTQITVSDTGSGIPPEELPKLFEKLRMIGGINERKTGGLGLGLFLAKAIVEAHGGTIEIESQVGQKTEVKIFLPKEKS